MENRIKNRLNNIGSISNYASHNQNVLKIEIPNCDKEIINWDVGFN